MLLTSTRHCSFEHWYLDFIQASVAGTWPSIVVNVKDRVHPPLPTYIITFWVKLWHVWDWWVNPTRQPCALNTRKAGKGSILYFHYSNRFGHCTLQELIIWEKLPRCDEVFWSWMAKQIPSNIFCQFKNYLLILLGMSPGLLFIYSAY